MVKSLVTGGAGFIGRSLVKLLLEQNHDVVVIDNLSNGSLENIDEFKDMENFSFIEGDISEHKVYDNLEPFDYIYHLAAQVNVQESLDFPEKSFKNNVIGTYNLLEWARKNNNNATILLMGTCMVYDTAGSEPISEEHALNPASPYAGSKLAAEDIALGYSHGLNMDIRIVRPFNTYGPYQKSNLEGGVVTIFCQKLIDGETINIYGDGKQTRDLLYVSDCANLLQTVATYENGKGLIINGGTGLDISINDLAQLIAQNSVKIQHIPHHHPQSEIMKLQCDNTKVHSLLNWYPKISLEEGINKTINFLKTR